MEPITVPRVIDAGDLRPCTRRSATGMLSDVPVIIDARHYDAVLFDLDGVVTDTATVHAKAWSQLFDEFLQRRAPRLGEDHSPFTDADYRCYVDGRSRLDGIRGFLSSRGITLADERSNGDDTRDSVCGLAGHKQRLFQDLLRSGVTVFDSTVALVRRLHDVHIRTAIYSASMNCRAILYAAGLDDLFGARVDGQVAAERHLAGKPDPAMLLEAATILGASPERCVVVEDAQAGVRAGRSGGFGMVVGVARHGHADDLVACGADAVVTDLSEVAVNSTPRAR